MTTDSDAAVHTCLVLLALLRDHVLLLSPADRLEVAARTAEILNATPTQRDPL